MDVQFIPAACFTSGRLFQKVDKIVCHWIDGYMPDADAVFTNPKFQSSAHFAVDNDSVHQYVKLQDTAWQAGNWWVNLHSVGIEHAGGPNMPISDATYETSAQLIAQICKQLGLTPSRSLLHKHSEYRATQCPGTLDLDRLAKRAVEVFNGTIRVPITSGVDQPIGGTPGTLASSNPPPGPTLSHYQFNFNLSPGMVGEEVGKLQDRLIELGVVMDVAGMQAGRGTYGPRTTQAVITFQMQHGVITSASDYGAGYCGPKTRSVLNNL